MKKHNEQNKNLPSLTGKLPPQAIDLEEAVLGAIILEKEAITMVGSILNPNLFYKEAHKVIYEAIQRLYSDSRPIDLLTVTNELRKMGKLEIAGGAFYIAELTSKVSSSAHIEEHCRILQQQYMKRESIAFGAELMRLSFDDTTDTFDIIEKGTEYTLKMTGMVDNGRMVTVKSAMMEFLEGLGRNMNRKEGELAGITSGINAVDRITGGWKHPDLIVIAARPGQGKTSIAIRCLISAAKIGIPVGIFSLEMSAQQLVARMAAQTYRICSVQDLKNGNISQDKFDYLVRKADLVANLPIQMDDTAGIYISQMRAKAHVMVRRQGVKMIVVDYLQLIQAEEGSGNREQQISSIARALKKLAKELEVPIIALAQLSRAVETRGGDRRPQLSDIRESGQIEADADVIAFLYRPEYYGIMQDEAGNSLAGVAELIFAKHRDGPLDSAVMRFLGHFTDFEDISSFEPITPQNEIGYTSPKNFRNDGTNDFAF